MASDYSKTTRRLDSPNCSTCRHFLPDNPSYPACAKVNVREGWKELTYMPTEPEDVCIEYEAREMVLIMSKEQTSTTPSLSDCGHSDRQALLPITHRDA